MKHIILFIVILSLFMACTKDSEYSAPDETIYTINKNSHRAVKISGTNIHWGNFILTLTYDKEQLDAGFLVNSKGDTIGDISVYREGAYLRYSIRDYVPVIDKDSINRLDAILQSKYGAGNYKLWDSIPKTQEILQNATLNLYENGLIQKQVLESFSPTEKADVVGEDFDFNYALISTNTSMYEYNVDGTVRFERMIQDMHDLTDAELYERFLYKTEATYDNEKIISLLWFTAQSGENFTEINRYNYSYNGEQLSEITAENFTRTFTYSGNQVTITTTGAPTMTCEIHNHGNVVKLDDGQGNIYTIEYEEGNGNLSLFTPLSERMLNPFFIK